MTDDLVERQWRNVYSRHMHVKMVLISSVVLGTTRKIAKIQNFIKQIKVKKFTTWLNIDGPGPNVTRLHGNVCQNRYFQFQWLRRNLKKSEIRRV